jgi:hypothetical protein
VVLVCGGSMLQDLVILRDVPEHFPSTPRNSSVQGTIVMEVTFVFTVVV